MNFFSFRYEFSSFLQYDKEDGDEDKRHADELDGTDLFMINDDAEKSSENRFESHDDRGFGLASILLSVGLHDESDPKHQNTGGKSVRPAVLQPGHIMVSERQPDDYLDQCRGQKFSGCE